MKLEVAMTNEISIVATEDKSAKSMCSGGLLVFATPAMVAGMETVCYNLAEKFMNEGETTVGTGLNISHVKATAIGDSVKFSCKVVAIEGRKLTFSVLAEDSKGKIGEGTHERFVINSEKFMAKL